MASVDIETIPEEVDKRTMYRTNRLDRFELREDGHIRILRAVFRCTVSGEETIRPIIWDPSKKRHHCVTTGKDFSWDSARELVKSWVAAVKPADAELMRQQLGIVEGVRESLELVEFRDKGAGI